jgi:hypothetical protein
MSRQDRVVETEAAWQSHYIFWCSIIGIPDPCGNKIRYQRIVAIYIKFVMCGINYYNKDVLRSSTLQGYATAVNTLFQLRGYKQPTKLLNPSNMPGIIINNLIKEETVASQRSPLDSAIFAELQQAASSSHSHDSNQNLLFDMLTLSPFIGPCASKYAQTTQEKIDYHVYPSGTCIIKAFTTNDFIFNDKNGHVLKKINNSILDTAKSVQITWRIQKNHQNGQKIKLSADTKNPALCSVQGAIRMVMRATRLEQPDNMPVACYRTKKAPLLYITGSRIATLIRKAVKKVQPSTLLDDLKKYSAHSLHVWAYVLLDEAGMSPSFIQKHLRWLGDSCKMYLRDTKAIQDKHLAALQTASSDVMALISTPPDNTVCLTATMSDLNVPNDIIEDKQMGAYIDKMD